MASGKRSENQAREASAGRTGRSKTARTGRGSRKPANRKDLFDAYLRTAIIVTAVVAVIAVVWLIVKPFRQRAEKAKLQAAVSESEALEMTVDSEAADGSGAAGRARIPEGMRVQYDTPGWQHDDRGWWYASDEKTFYVNGWSTLDQQEYHFDSTGYMDTGWTPIGGKGCYFDEHGVYDPSADSSHMIALTFDDGPGELTSGLLDTLEENHVRATFFMLGQMVEQYGAETIPRMVKLGCQLGNHSYDHSDMTTLSTSAALQQFQETDEQIAKYSGGAAATVIRFPYGSFNDAIESKIDKPSIYWDFDTVDWQGIEASELANKVVSEAEGGNIILMHDIHQNSVDAVKIMVPKLKEAGFEMVTIEELAAARGYELKAGVTYYGFTDTDIAYDSVSDEGRQQQAADDSASDETNAAADENSDGQTQEQSASDETGSEDSESENSSYEEDSESSGDYDQSYDEEDTGWEDTEDSDWEE